MGCLCRFHAYLDPVLLPHIHRPTLDPPHPPRERRVEDEVHDHSVHRQRLCRLEAELEVVIEGGSGNGAGGEAKGEADISEGMDLLVAD